MRQVIRACGAAKGGDPQQVRESQRRRFADVSLVDRVIELDAKWRDGVPCNCKQDIGFSP